MATYWTIEYFPPGGGPSVQKAFGDVNETLLGWGISDAKLQRVSLNIDVFSCVADGQEFDSAAKFDYGAKVVVWRDRDVDVAGVFSGGTRYFQGVVTGIKHLGKSNNHSVSYVFSGPWWYLDKIVYEQTFNPSHLNASTTHVVLGYNTQTNLLINTGAQIKDILDVAIAKGALLQYENSFPDVAAPTDEKKDIPCSEAIKAELRWTPSAVSYFDYTFDPPKLIIKERGSMTGTSVALPTVPTDPSVQITSQDIVPRHDLLVPQVIIRYEQSNTVNGSPRLAIVERKHPASTSTEIGIFRATVNLIGFTAKEQTAELETRAIAGTVSTTAFWQEKLDWLNNVTGLAISAVSVPGDALNNELVEGGIHSWMRIGGVTPVTHKTVVVKAKAQFDLPDGSKSNKVDISCRIKTTNASTGPFTRTVFTSFAEPIPSNLEVALYNNLSVLQWEGQVTLEASEVSTQQFMGRVLNITGGAAAWATMNATVQSVNEDINSGTVVVNFGVNRFLNPGELVDLLRVSRARQATSYLAVIASSTNLGSDSVESGKNMPKENSTKGPTQYQKQIISYEDTADPPGSPAHKITNDALNRVIVIEGKTAEGTIRLKVGSDGDGTGAAGKDMKIREWTGFTKAGVPVRVLSSEVPDAAGGGGYEGDYDPTKTYTEKKIVRVTTGTNAGVWAVKPGATALPGQPPTFPEPAGSVWHLLSLPVNIVNKCQTGSGQIYINSSIPF